MSQEPKGPPVYCAHSWDSHPWDSHGKKYPDTKLTDIVADRVSPIILALRCLICGYLWVKSKEPQPKKVIIGYIEIPPIK